MVFANNTYNRLLEASWLLAYTSWNTFEASRLLTLLTLLAYTSWNTFEASRLLTLLTLLAKCTFEASWLLTLLRLLRLLRLLTTLRLLMLLSNITNAVKTPSSGILSGFGITENGKVRGLNLKVEYKIAKD